MSNRRVMAAAITRISSPLFFLLSLLVSATVRKIIFNDNMVAVAGLLIHATRINWWLTKDRQNVTTLWGAARLQSMVVRSKLWYPYICLKIHYAEPCHETEATRTHTPRINAWWEHDDESVVSMSRRFILSVYFVLSENEQQVALSPTT